MSVYRRRRMDYSESDFERYLDSAFYPYGTLTLTEVKLLGYWYGCFDNVPAIYQDSQDEYVGAVYYVPLPEGDQDER